MTTLRNSVQLIGRLGMDPEVKTFENDQTKVRFTLATSDYYKNKEGERVEETQWHNIVAWGRLAKIAESYLTKGKEIADSLPKYAKKEVMMDNIKSSGRSTFLHRVYNIKVNI